MDAIDDLMTFDKVKSLLKFEEQIRAEFANIDGRTIGGWLNEAEKMGPTLNDLAILLMIKSAKKASKNGVADRLVENLNSNLVAYVPTTNASQLQLPLG